MLSRTARSCGSTEPKGFGAATYDISEPSSTAAAASFFQLASRRLHDDTGITQKSKSKAGEIDKANSGL